MIRVRKILRTELLVIISLWLIVLASPLFFIDDFDQNWRAVHIMWTECVIVGLVFLINRFLLMPYLFFAKKYIKYVVVLAIIFVILGVFVVYYDGVNSILSLIDPSMSSTPVRGDQYLDMFSPRSSSSSLPPPRFVSPEGLSPRGLSPRGLSPKITAIPPTVTIMVFAAIVIALDMGLSIAVKWMISEHKQSEINRERVSAQLSNLQSQVSPHFFMNTLNNIHALVDIDSERAKKTIIELSGLMDYLLYDSSSKDSVFLQRELDFIGSYISLMRLRYPNHVVIDFAYDKNVPTVKIPPLLFLNFIENAFKYGVDYDKESFIKISIYFKNSGIEMLALNSDHSECVTSRRHGLGISNSRKRLDLLYGSNYSLDIGTKEGVYCVDLKIPII